MNEQQPGTHALFVSTSTTPTRPPPTEVMHDPGYRPVLIEPPPGRPITDRWIRLASYWAARTIDRDEERDGSWRRIAEYECLLFW